VGAGLKTLQLGAEAYLYRAPLVSMEVTRRQVTNRRPSRPGLGANQPDNAIYPVLAADADGASLAGDNYYLCRGPIS
jgi:hypothetical protein